MPFVSHPHTKSLLFRYIALLHVDCNICSYVTDREHSRREEEKGAEGAGWKWRHIQQRAAPPANHHRNLLSRLPAARRDTKTRWCLAVKQRTVPSLLLSLGINNKLLIWPTLTERVTAAGT